MGVSENYAGSLQGAFPNAKTPLQLVGARGEGNGRWSLPVLDADADLVSAVCVGVVLFVAGKGAQYGGDEVW